MLISRTETIEDLQAEYIRLTTIVLPGMAGGKCFCVRLDHCFQRIILDHTVGAKWKTVLTNKKVAAYRQLSESQLVRAIEIANEIAQGSKQDLAILNETSLRWRGKL